MHVRLISSSKNVYTGIEKFTSITQEKNSNYFNFTSLPFKQTEDIHTVKCMMDIFDNTCRTTLTTPWTFGQMQISFSWIKTS